MAQIRREDAVQLLRLAKRNRSAARLDWDALGIRFREIFSQRGITVVQPSNRHGFGALLMLLALVSVGFYAGMFSLF